MQRSEAVTSLEASHADLLLQVGQTQARMGELSSQLADLEINYRDLEVGLTLAGEDVYQHIIWVHTFSLDSAMLECLFKLKIIFFCNGYLNQV